MYKSKQIVSKYVAKLHILFKNIPLGLNYKGASLIIGISIF